MIWYFVTLRQKNHHQKREKFDLLSLGNVPKNRTLKVTLSILKGCILIHLESAVSGTSCLAPEELIFSDIVWQRGNLKWRRYHHNLALVQSILSLCVNYIEIKYKMESFSHTPLSSWGYRLKGPDVCDLWSDWGLWGRNSKRVQHFQAQIIST